MNYPTTCALSSCLCALPLLWVTSLIACFVLYHGYVFLSSTDLPVIATHTSSDAQYRAPGVRRRHLLQQHLLHLTKRRDAMMLTDMHTRKECRDSRSHPVTHSDGPARRRRIAKEGNAIRRTIARPEYISTYFIRYYKFPHRASQERALGLKRHMPLVET